MVRAPALVATIFALAGSARAERRLFPHVFQYGTQAPEATGVALWYDETRPRWKQSEARLDYTLEIRHGLTEHWDAALFTVFAQLASGDPSRAQPFGLDHVRLQNRYRFADRSEWPADLQLQLDVGKRFGPSIYDVELRAVVAHDIDKIALAANVAGIVTIGNDTTRELALLWAAGASYELHPVCNVGVEAFGRVDESVAAAGPVLSLAPSSRLWLAVSAAAGLTGETDELLVRALLGVEL